jgi:prepilin-type N-terminal cleavage/methylation domain-containing protein
MARRYRHRAFSLVELALVIAIVAVVAAVAVPRYADSAARYRLDLAARRVAADLDLARSLARTSSTSVAVAFLPKENFYKIEQVADLLNKPGPHQIHLGGAPYHAMLVSAEFGSTHFGSAGSNSVTFNGHGIASSGGTVVLRAGRYQKTVTLDPFTGKAKVQQPWEQPKGWPWPAPKPL